MKEYSQLETTWQLTESWSRATSTKLQVKNSIQKHSFNTFIFSSIPLIRTFVNFCITAALHRAYESLMYVFALPGLFSSQLRITKNNQHCLSETLWYRRALMLSGHVYFSANNSCEDPSGLGSVATRSVELLRKRYRVLSR